MESNNETKGQNDAEENKGSIEKKNKKKTHTRLIIGMVVILAVALGALVYISTQKKEAEPDPVKKVQKQKKIVAEVKKEAPKEPIRAINFAELQAVNPDIYAWIEIPNTNIDYPVLQAVEGDQAYYLNNTYDRIPSIQGSIYTENLNARDFMDPNTLIYGHELLDGTMFTQLHAYEDDAFFRNSPYVYIYTPEKRLKYQIFAAVEFDDRHIMMSTDFKDPAAYQAFLDDVRSRRDMVSHVNDEVPVDTNSKIVTLSTCIAAKPSSRWIVTAVLVEERNVNE